MPWELRIRDKRPTWPQVGDCWFAPYMLKRTRDGKPMLAERYFREWAGIRDPFVVVLPVGEFCVDSHEETSEDGWQVLGEPPRITVRPSINIVGGWHGYITAGVISDNIG